MLRETGASAVLCDDPGVLSASLRERRQQNIAAPFPFHFTEALISQSPSAVSMHVYVKSTPSSTFVDMSRHCRNSLEELSWYYHDGTATMG